MKKNSSKIKRAIDSDIEKDFREIRDQARDKLSKPVQDYLGALVDPKRHGKAGIPTLMGGVPGHTGNEYYRLQGDVQIGSSSIGFLAVNPMSLVGTTMHGPLSGAAVVLGTQAGWAGTALPVGGTAVPAGSFIQTLPGARSAASILDRGDFQCRVVGISVEIFPESSWSLQDGRISMLEWPGHVEATATTTLAEFESNKRTRTIRSASAKDGRSEKIVLNFHPRVSLATGAAQIDDYQFIDLVSRTAAVTAFAGPLTFMFSGTPGSQFHYDISFLYEVRGRLVLSTRARLVDSRGMDLVSNMISAKQLSGFLGNPVHVTHSYLGMAWEMGKKLWGSVKTPVKEAALEALKDVAGFL